MADLRTILVPGSNVDMAALRDWLMAPDQWVIGASTVLGTLDFSEASGTSAEEMAFSDNIHVAVNQNAGDPDFPDNIVHCRGWNIGANGARLDTSKAAYSIRLERSYYLNGDDSNPIGFESHWQLDTISGGQIRPLTCFAAHDGSLTLLTAQVDEFSVEHPTSPGTGQFKIDFANDVVSMTGLSLLAANNVPISLQLNAAGDAQITLGYIDNLDGLRFTAPIHHITGAEVNPNGNTSFVFRSLQSPATGNYGEMVLLGSAITGASSTFIERYFSGSVNGVISTQRTNSHATGGLQQEHYTTAGDVSDFIQIGGSFFRVGMRASDAAYCISPTGFLDGAGIIVRQNGRLSLASVPPASAGADGEAGDIAWDSGFLYVCTATDTWKRVAIATW